MSRKIRSTRLKEPDAGFGGPRARCLRGSDVGFAERQTGGHFRICDIPGGRGAGVVRLGPDKICLLGRRTSPPASTQGEALPSRGSDGAMGMATMVACNSVCTVAGVAGVSGVSGVAWGWWRGVYTCRSRRPPPGFPQLWKVSQWRVSLESCIRNEGQAAMLLSFICWHLSAGCPYKHRSASERM